MSTKTPTCTWTDAGWITPESDGARPCPKDHCGLRGIPCGSHVKHAAGIYTCPGCIARFRRDLATIKALCAVELVEEALEAGINSEAATLIGPASLDAPSDSEVREADDWQRGRCAWPKRPERPVRHPLVVLGDLDLALRETYGPQTTLLVTVDRAADFLTELLAGPFPHEDQFEPAAREIRHLKDHLETIAHTARRVEQGHRCPACTKLLPEDEKAPRLRKHYATGSGIDVQAGRLDTWHCPRDTAHWWTDADYRNEIDTQTRTSVAEGRWLTAAEIAEAFGIKPARLRKWEQRKQVKSRWIAEKLRYDTTGVRAMLADNGASA